MFHGSTSLQLSISRMWR